MSFNKRNLLFCAVIIFSLILSGCGLLGGEEKKQIDPPQKVTYEDKGKAGANETTSTKEKSAKENTAVEKTVMTELYLVDKEGYVVPQSMALPKTEGIAKQAVEYLVKNGPVTEMLPNNFQAVLPEDTRVSVDIKDNTATVDFSKEFKNYKPEDELKILQSVTWTLTQFDSVDKVKLQINGEELKEMPVNKTPVNDGLSRADGINLDTKDVVDIANTKPVTVYYIRRRRRGLLLCSCYTAR